MNRHRLLRCPGRALESPISSPGLQNKADTPGYSNNRTKTGTRFAFTKR
jgi:hypothetical protein